MQFLEVLKEGAIAGALTKLSLLRLFHLKLNQIKKKIKAVFRVESLCRDLFVEIELLETFVSKESGLTERYYIRNSSRV